MKLWKKIMLRTSNAWSVTRSSKGASKTAYYIIDWRIFEDCQISIQYSWSTQCDRSRSNANGILCLINAIVNDTTCQSLNGIERVWKCVRNFCHTYWWILEGLIWEYIYLPNQRIIFEISPHLHLGAYGKSSLV